MQNVTPEQVETMSGPELVAAYNALGPKKPVKRFANRDIGVRRVLEALEAAAAAGDGPETPAGAGQDTTAPVAAATTPEEPSQPQPEGGPEQAAPKRSGGRRAVRHFEPGGELKAPRPTSKRGKLLEWLVEPEGMSADEIATMFEWTPRDVKDALRLLAKVNGYVVFLGDDERWHAAEPEGE